MSLENEIERIRKQTESAKAKEIKAITDAAAANKQLVTDSYNTQIADTKESYEGLFRKNAVQKVLNERDLERRAAEMGLTDSGLSRTQMTANQLSYANQNAEYRRAQQKAVDTLAAAMRSKNAEIDIKANNDIANINTAYEKSAIEQGTNLYNTEQDRISEAETQRLKNEQQYEIDLIKANTANTKAENESTKLSNQAAEDEAEASTKVFNTLYKNIANEHKAVESDKPLKRHAELIYTYQMDNDLKADSLEIKQLLSAAGISSEKYESYLEEKDAEAMKQEADENYQPLKTKKAETFLAGLKGQILWKLRSTASKETWQKSVENLMDKENLSVSEVLWVSQQLGFI